MALGLEASIKPFDLLDECWLDQSLDPGSWSYKNPFMLSFIWMVLVGFGIGLLARFLKPGNDKLGFILTSAVGIFGSILAGFVGRSMGFYSYYEPAGFLSSVIGAVVLLALLQYIKGRKS